ncbi:hypothetical protein FGAF1267_06490 [Escherichia coli]|nr:hypothetical protein FGAF1267_06490 [Escherichia coli]
MKIGLELENCYGINKLVGELDLTRFDGIDGVCSLYAPNGTLKTSLAKTLKDIEEGGNDSNLLIVFYVQIMPDDFVMQLHRF